MANYGWIGRHKVSTSCDHLLAFIRGSFYSILFKLAMFGIFKVIRVWQSILQDNGTSNGAIFSWIILVCVFVQFYFWLFKLTTCLIPLFACILDELEMRCHVLVPVQWANQEMTLYPTSNDIIPEWSLVV